ncbi:MAG: UvrD-helicase domain-containing protein [Bacteroidota bacterium]
MAELTPYQKEALDFSSNILLTANAGSGKTFVLSKRFVEIVLQENVDLDNIVAITFTDKAAGELNKRIADEIEQRILGDRSTNNIKKLENVRRQLVSANISTIHSFCVNILREFAPEAGIDTNFNPIDQPTANELIEISIEETINGLINDKDRKEEIKYLIRFFGSKNALASNLKNALYHRKQININLTGLYSKTEQEIAEKFNQLFKNYFDLLFKIRIEEMIHALSVINNAVLKKEKGNQFALDILDLQDKLKGANTFEKRLVVLKKIKESLLTKTERTVKKAKYLGKDYDEYRAEIELIEKLFSEIENMIDVENSAVTEYELARFGKIFITVYQQLLSLYSNKKHQKGYLDFEDILLKTQEILEQKEVQEFLRSKFKYIMIDEYQDTNELQYNIFMPILDFLKHGNLFVVGDEKQSIYKFRDAELEIFNRTKDDINTKSSEGRLLELPHSFRMAPQIVLFTNQLFEKLFSNPKEELNEVKYKNLICAKDENEKGTVEFLFSEKESIQTEPELTAAKILWLVENEKLSFSEIGILCRKRNQFRELENTFVKCSIPYTVVGGKGFFQRQSIYDIYNYISFLINNEDDAALLGILRSPFYNIDDNTIFEISLEDGKTLYNKLILYSEKNNLTRNAVDQLKSHIEITNSVRTYELVRRILADCNYWAVTSAKKNSFQEKANLEKLLQIAREFSGKGFKNLYDFTLYLKNAIENIEDEGQAQVIKNENAVSILTIHQSKGMEYKAVFLYGTNAYTKDDSVKSKTLSIDKNFGLLAKVPLKNNFFDRPVAAPVVSLYNYINYKKNSAELKRLLYVAVTRAMNYLFITGSNTDKIQKDSFLELIMYGLEIETNLERIQLENKVQFMKTEKKEYIFYDKKIALAIPIVKTIEFGSPAKKIRDELKPISKFYINTINDIAKKEIISATKISMYKQCPVKYQLTYELGYSTIYDLVKEYQNNYEFNSKEDGDVKLKGDVRGRIIHSILKENLKPEELENFISKKFIEEQLGENKSINGWTGQIKNDVKLFYESNAFVELSSQVDFKNEYEIYCEEGEYYLYGIIDKLVFDKDRVVIIDYKTDDVTVKQIPARAEEYLHQLKFYAYLVNKMFGDKKKIISRLIFIKYPDIKVEYEIEQKELVEYRAELNEAIKKIHNREYKKDLNHCSKCHFALEGNKCVKP